MAECLVGPFLSLPLLLAGLGCGYLARREASCPWETEGCRLVPRSLTLACDHSVDPCDPPVPCPGLDVLCLCGGEGVGLSPVAPCGLCWALGLGAAVGADPGLPHLCEEDGLLAEPAGVHLHSGGLLWLGLCLVCLSVSSVYGEGLRFPAPLLLLKS